MPRRVSALVLFFTLGASLVSAQNVGKLAGRVVSGVDGTPLPGATVVVEGTTFGAAANAEGEYFIIGLPVGTYSVRASFVGFESHLFTSVEVNQDFTRELSFTLTENVATFEVIEVEYERPLIQKDAIGVPRVVSGKDMQNLAVRGIAQIAAIQGGVVGQEGREDLNVRGGRREEVVYFIDGMKVIGTTGTPQQAIQEQEMLIGSLPAKYGDAMSGIISITTKSGRSDLFGSAEAITSEGLDEYGYNLASLSLGGPLLGEKLNFFVAGEFVHNDDWLPSAIDVPRLRENRLAFLKENPQSLRFLDAEGNKVYLPLPGDANPTVDSGGDERLDAVPFDEMLASMNIPDGYTLDSPTPVSGAEVEPLSSYEFKGSRPNFERDRYAVSGNLNFAATDAIRIRLSGRYDNVNQSGATNMRRVVLDSDRLLKEERYTYGFAGTWTHRLSNATFYQLHVDWSRYKSLEYDPAFLSDVEDVLFYGDIDHPANAVAARQWRWDQRDSLYVPRYEDGSLPSDGEIYDVLTDVGVGNRNFRTEENDQLRITAQATTQFGIHQIEFGGEFELRTERFFEIGGTFRARFFDDGFVEGSSDAVVSGYEQLPFFAGSVAYWGYDYLGIDRSDGGEVDTFVSGALGSCNEPSGGPDPACDSPPHEPVLYAGYVQDKVEYKDLVLNLGLRVDVFDNNALVLKDPYALIPIVRAGDISGRPGNIGTEFGVYFDGGDNVVGYRDLEGNFFDDGGQDALAADILSLGTPRVPEGVAAHLSSEVLEDYDPEVTWMPRVGVSFAVTGEALFFAHYDRTSQRPTEQAFASIPEYFFSARGGGFGIGNPGLRPQSTTEYELGFRQRVGVRSSLMISGFYRKIDNLIQFDWINVAHPSGYTTFGNQDFGTVKGVQFEFDLRRTAGVALNSNYTLQFARGTGSDRMTSGRATFRSRAPDFLFPLDFDRRHSINVNLDYRLGEGEGPSVAGATILENFGFNIIGSFYSGLPYTPRKWPSRTVSGDLNGDRMTWSSRVHVRVDRRFELGKDLSLTAFLWIQNLLDAENELAVYTTSGLPSDDGWLATGEGKEFLKAAEVRLCGTDCDGEISEIAKTLYSFSRNSPWLYGIPRLTRLGLRFNF